MFIHLLTRRHVPQQDTRKHQNLQLYSCRDSDTFLRPQEPYSFHQGTTHFPELIHKEEEKEEQKKP